MNYTKKMLQEHFELSDNTVYKTLKVCRLDTKKTEYTQEEIETRFIPARKLLDAGKTYKEIENYFATKEAQGAKAQVDWAATPNGHSSSQEFLDVVHREVSQSLSLMVQSAVTDLIGYLPEMTARALATAAHRGDIQRTFEQYRKEFTENSTALSFQSPFGQLPEAVDEEDSFELGEFELEENGDSDYEDFAEDEGGESSGGEEGLEEGL